MCFSFLFFYKLKQYRWNQFELVQQQWSIENCRIQWKKEATVCRMEFGIVVAGNSTCGNWFAFGYLDIIDDDSLRRRRFFFFAVRLSWPLSVFESSLSDSLSDELELDEDDDELELLELSDAKPVASFRLTRSAISARSGSFSYISTKLKFYSFQSESNGISITFRTFNHFFDNFGRPRTVLCHTIGKFVLLQKFCVTAIVSSRFSTTCQ